MSGPAFRNGEGQSEGEDSGDRPRVPSQRAQPDDGPTPEFPAPSPAGTRPETAADTPAEPAAEDEDFPASELPRDPRLPARTRVLGSSQPQPVQFDHGTLKSLLGAWALTVCSADESLAVEVHLTDCATCADEALRLRDAVGLLHQEESLDLNPLLRARVLEGCLGRRPARIPVPEWASPYDAEAARLDALLRDLGDGYWKEPVELRWYQGRSVKREFTVGQVIAHLTAVDGLLGRALGLPASGLDTEGAADDEPGQSAPTARASGLVLPSGPGDVPDDLPLDPQARTSAHWATQGDLSGEQLRTAWREQSHALVRTVSFADGGVADLGVDYGSFALPMRDAFVDRAFECWIHATDIADAVAYPYDPPAPRHLGLMVDLAARMLPEALAGRRRAGLTAWPARLVAAGAPGRSMRLEVEGHGGGEWWVSLDSPGAVASPDEMVAHVAMDSMEFCQLAAGHLEPDDVAAGQEGDRDVVRDVLFAAASMSRL
jgi:hypothetical protein